ncbi:hypothetical protein OAO01_00880 [Oligoflexia bacterium]|nr:hypothetical protein [Oligoflexia bacterium]
MHCSLWFTGGLNMNTMDKLLNISSRIEHLENAAEWIAKEAIHTDSGISQTSTLIYVLADEIREMVFELAQELERGEEQETIH